MSEEHVRTARHGRVLEVVLDRPKANAIDAETSRTMGEVFAAFRDDPELKVAVLMMLFLVLIEMVMEQ